MSVRCGVTLLEALVALVLISLGGLQALAAVATARDAESHAAGRLEAAVLAEYVVVQVRLGLIDPPKAVERPQPFAEPFHDYTWTISPDTGDWRIQVFRVTVEGHSGAVELLVAKVPGLSSRLNRPNDGEPRWP